MRILIVEDDRELAQSLANVLQEAGMIAETAHDGNEAAFLGSTETYDAAVLDLGLPGMDGISLLTVLILTGRSRWSDKLAGFNAGADDYLTKPFLHEEVVLRLRALLRRSRGHADTTLHVGSLSYDTLQARFHLDGRRLTLTAQEERILAYLMHQPGVVVSRGEILEHVYARDSDPDSNALDVLISRIRRKLGVPLLHTIRGRGFMLAAETPKDDT